MEICNDFLLFQKAFLEGETPKNYVQNEEKKNRENKIFRILQEITKFW